MRPAGRARHLDAGAPVSLRLTPDERALLLTDRALKAYVAERSRLDALDDEPPPELLVWLELEGNGAGRMVAQRMTCGEGGGRDVVAAWDDIGEAAAKIDRELESARAAHVAAAVSAFDRRRAETAGADRAEGERRRVVVVALARGEITHSEAVKRLNRRSL